MSEKNINDVKQKENIKVSGNFYCYNNDPETKVPVMILHNITDADGNLIKDRHWIKLIDLPAPLVGGLLMGEIIEFDAEIIEEPLYHLGKKIIKASNIRKV